MKKKLYPIILTAIFAAILFYIALPAINIQSPGFWIYLFMVLIFYGFIHVVGILERKSKKMKGQAVQLVMPVSIKFPKWIIAPVAVFICLIVLSLIYSPIFLSSKYASRITINEDGVFAQEVSIVDFNTLPLLDKDSSSKLGDRVMGQMPEYVSQFQVSDLYTQINYQESVVRVTPLEYNGFFKYWNNKDDGAQGYIKVNSVTGNTELVKLTEGMKYLDSAYFNENLTRKLRFSYPFYVFGDYSFEIDDDGSPYWICPVMSYKAIGKLEDVKGVVILDPVTGDSDYYDVGEVPSWVDHVYPSDLIIEQVDDWGSYQGGFINSMIGQKNVVNTTDGYNYLASDGDIYLYTGITSAAADESNLGFILTNLRTKETTFYSCPGAEEYSAMASAEGQVQQMEYTASFPLLINLENRPTYLISLKDNAGLVKMYAFVDVEDYQNVVVSNASDGIVKAAKNYVGGNFSYETISDDDLIKKTITIASINQVTIEGTTYFYFTDLEGNKYKAIITVSQDFLPFMEVGQEVKIGYVEEEDVTSINTIQ